MKKLKLKKLTKWAAGIITIAGIAMGSSLAFQNSFNNKQETNNLLTTNNSSSSTSNKEDATKKLKEAGILDGTGTKKIKFVSMSSLTSAVVIEDDNGNGSVSEVDTLYMWGDNTWGQQGKTAGATKYPTPHKVTPKDNNGWKGNIKGISMSDNTSAVWTEDPSDATDHLYMWGDNQYKQQGIDPKDTTAYNNGKDVITPTEVSKDGMPSSGVVPFVGIKGISMSSETSAVWTQGSNHDDLYMWGANGEGQQGIGSQGQEDLQRSWLRGFSKEAQGRRDEKLKARIKWDCLAWDKM